jgi:uncharacterized protein YndB with AHSA1/START domain/DNA-binding transcriptional ArsR family regulator
MSYQTTLEILADPTRRTLVERLRGGPLPVGRLAAGLPVSRPAVSKHLRLMKEAGVVRMTENGTRNFYDRERHQELLRTRPRQPRRSAALPRPLLGRIAGELQASSRVIQQERTDTMSNGAAGVAAAHKSETAVRKSVTVDVDRERAFAVFTEGFDTWWMRSHHIGAVDMDVAVIEPREGGRWYERGVDGTECDWGHVMAWEPPARIVLAWQINAGWQYDPSLVTEVEVTFTEDGPRRTRVDLEHRHLDRMGEAAEQMRGVFDSDAGWSGLLRLYADRANTAE